MSNKLQAPRVWLDLDQAALDAAYDQSQFAPNMAQVLRRHACNSELVRARLGEPQRLAYGPAPIESLDIYRTSTPDAPVCVFIHGGAWRDGSARDNAFAAELFVQAGVHCVVPDFSSVLETRGSLMPMADQVRRAVAWVYRHAAEFGGNPERVHVLGHSSGAHLAGVVLTTDWPGTWNLPQDIVKSGLCCSGMFDLKPVRLSARSAYVKFTDEMEQALSPQRHLQHLHAPLTLAYGTLESPEFQRQSRQFATAVQAAGKPVTLLLAQEYNHFEIIETLANPYSLLGSAALARLAVVQS